VIRTWGKDKNNKAIDKPLSIKPAFTVSKAVQSTKAVTLYKATPMTGQSLNIRLTTPANVKPGAVQLNQASLNGLKLVTSGSAPGAIVKSDGFRLEQSGAGDWTIYFKETTAPKALDAKGKIVNPKQNYTIRIELWADGTYKLNSSGKPEALKNPANGNAMTKPTYVNVKVILK